MTQPTSPGTTDQGDRNVNDLLITAYRSEVRAIMALREERMITVPNLRDFGFERITEYREASHAWAAEQDRLNDVAQRLHGETVRLRTSS